MNSQNKLTQEKLAELMNRYYAGEKNAILIEEFGLDVLVNEIHKLFPLVKHKDIKCPYCDIPLVHKPLSKSAIKYGFSNETAFCTQCGHKNHDCCQCGGCKVERDKYHQEIKNKKRIFLKSTHRDRLTSSINIYDLKLTDVLSLVSLARVGLQEERDLILPVIHHPSSFCTRKQTTIKIIDDLFTKGLIEVSTKSDLSAVNFEYPNQFSVNVADLSWCFRLGKDQAESLRIIDLFEKTLGDRDQWPGHWNDELYEIWKELALEELIAYLELKLVEHRYIPRIGEKTMKVMMSLLDNFPVTQIYNFIWGSVTNSAAYQIRSGISKQHAANTVIGNCQRRAEKALAEKWPIKDYKRDYQLPDSMRVSIFSNVVTGLGERFFTEIPRNEI